MSWFKKEAASKNYIEGEAGFDYGNIKDNFSENDKRNISAIIESLPDGILIFDEKKSLMLINSQAQFFLNISGAELIGKSILELSKYPYCRPLISILGGGIIEVKGEKIEFRPDLIMEISSSSLLVEGRKVGTVAILRNVTEKESIERVKSDFITIAAHKLRTPTSAIKWLSQGLIDGDNGELSKEQKETTEKISIANQRVIDLVNNLLNSVEIEGGKYLSTPALFDIEEIILSVANELRDLAEKNNISIKMEKTEDKMPRIMMDKEKIRIAISDLLDNALRYNNSGGKVSIYLAKKGEDIIVAIKDSGVGIPKKEQEQLFVKFFRGEKALKIDTEGKGLGLFIAKNIIEENGGSIWFESNEGTGSTFFFSLPIKQKYGEYMTGKFY
jgi:PAS domain S-box-containing protein